MIFPSARTNRFRFELLLITGVVAVGAGTEAVVGVPSTETDGVVDGVQVLVGVSVVDVVDVLVGMEVVVGVSVVDVGVQDVVVGGVQLVVVGGTQVVVGGGGGVEVVGAAGASSLYHHVIWNSPRSSDAKLSKRPRDMSRSP